MKNNIKQFLFLLIFTFSNIFSQMNIDYKNGFVIQKPTLKEFESCLEDIIKVSEEQLDIKDKWYKDQKYFISLSIMHKILIVNLLLLIKLYVLFSNIAFKYSFKL